MMGGLTGAGAYQVNRAVISGEPNTGEQTIQDVAAWRPTIVGLKITPLSETGLPRPNRQQGLNPEGPGRRRNSSSRF